MPNIAPGPPLYVYKTSLVNLSFTTSVKLNNLLLLPSLPPVEMVFKYVGKPKGSKSDKNPPTEIPLESPPVLAKGLIPCLFRWIPKELPADYPIVDRGVYAP